MPARLPGGRRLLDVNVHTTLHEQRVWLGDFTDVFYSLIKCYQQTVGISCLQQQTELRSKTTNDQSIELYFIDLADKI